MASDLVMPHYGNTHMGLHIGISYRPATFDCMEKVGPRIRELRKALDMNQVDLARKTDLDQSTISDIERGSGFSADVLVRICRALGVSLDYLMVGVDDRTWPFPRVRLERFLALDAEDRAYVEGKLEAAMDGVTAPPTPPFKAINVSATLHRQSPKRSRAA